MLLADGGVTGALGEAAPTSGNTSGLGRLRGDPRKAKRRELPRECSRARGAACGTLARMPLLLILILLLLLFGGGGYYMGPGVGYYGGGGLSLVLLIVILYLLFGRGRSRL